MGMPMERTAMSSLSRGTVGKATSTIDQADEPSAEAEHQR